MLTIEGRAVRLVNGAVLLGRDWPSLPGSDLEAQARPDYAVRDIRMAMSKIDQLTSAAEALPEAQLDGLIAFARDLASEPAYYSVSADVLASIERGLSEHAASESRPAGEVFARLARRIDTAQP